jgi:hypothetical protein
MFVYITKSNANNDELFDLVEIKDVTLKNSYD